NLIPPQRAGTIAVTADLVGADKRWCEVSHLTYESVKHKNIHVIGDSTIGLPVPKSGNIANAMGKICAVAVTSLLNDKPAPSVALTVFGRTCSARRRRMITALIDCSARKETTMRVLTSWLLVLAFAGPVVAGPLDMPGASQALVCSACHGFAGQSQSNTMPILAGIAPWYFKKAIQDYAAGKRTSPEMEPYAKAVLQSGVDDVAAYF